MKPLPHHYDVHLAGGPSGHAQLSTAGVPALRMAPPVEYGGPGDAWSPEHALLAAGEEQKACLVSASLSTPIRLEPEVTEDDGTVHG